MIERPIASICMYRPPHQYQIRIYPRLLDVCVIPHVSTYVHTPVMISHCGPLQSTHIALALLLVAQPSSRRAIFIISVRLVLCTPTRCRWVWTRRTQLAPRRAFETGLVLHSTQSIHCRQNPQKKNAYGHAYTVQ